MLVTLADIGAVGENSTGTKMEEFSMDASKGTSAKQRLVFDTLERVLGTAGLAVPDMREILITEKSVVEKSTYDALTKAILEYDIPKVTTPCLLDHYTEGPGYRGILNSRELWLGPLSPRLSEGELATFAWEHGLDGYVNQNGPPRPLLSEAIGDLFYASFCTPPASAHLWERFGGDGNGYRLRFRVTANGAADLRTIRYHGPTTLLKQVNDALVEKELPRLVLKGISRVGAFYLPDAWRAEAETRLFAKRFEGGGAPVREGSQGEYWAIPIGIENETAQVDLVEIGVRRLDPAIVRSKLPSWANHVPVTIDS